VLDNAVLVVHPNDESQPTIRLSPAFGGRLASLASKPASPKGRSSHLVNNSVSNDPAGRRLALPQYLSEPAPRGGGFTSVAVRPRRLVTAPSPRDMKHLQLPSPRI